MFEAEQRDASRFKEQGISTGNAIVLVFVVSLIIVGLLFVCIFVIPEVTSRGIAVEVEVVCSVGDYNTRYVGFSITNAGNVDIGLSYLMVQMDSNWQILQGYQKSPTSLSPVSIEFLPIGGCTIVSGVLSSVTSGRYNGKFVLADGSYEHKFTFVI